MSRLVAVAVGLWLEFAPAVLDFGDPAATNDRITGPVAAGIAFVALWPVVRPLRWGVLPAGLWLLVAPLALGYDEWVTWINSIVAGVALLATMPFGRADADVYGGGWSALWQDRPPTRARPDGVG